MSPDEVRAAQKDAAAQEQAGAVPHPVNPTAPTWVRAVHPDHGQTVTFVPGESVPAWVAEHLPAEPDEHGVIDLTGPAPAAKAKAPARRRRVST